MPADKIPSTTTTDALREKEEFNFALFQHNPLPMVVVDRHGCVLKSNLARRTFDDQLPELGVPLFGGEGQQETELAAALNAYIAEGEVKEFPELPIGARWLAITMAPFPKGAVVIINDITALKQLIQADKMVVLGTLVSGVAHEISNPNNAMLLSAAVLKKTCTDIIPILDRIYKTEGDFEIGGRDYSEVREDLPDLVDVVTRASERIKSFVDDLKAFARKGPDTLDETVDINAIVDAAVHLLGALIRKSTQRFAAEQNVSIPMARGNTQRLEQVVINLLTNACQALPDRTRGVTVATRHDEPTNEIIIEVRDEGDGIAPENLARITDPFFTTKKDDGGTGLGLSISKTIIDHHGGKLIFTSEPGKGTIATIRLPALNTDRPATERTTGL